MGESKSGKLIIISGPSGAGKSSVVAKLIERCELPLEKSVSATTRPPRTGEIRDVDYHFLTLEQFRQRQEADEFLESVEVFGQDWYGTLRQPVDRALAKGRWVILEIDVTGALMVLKTFPDAVTIFVHPGGREELEARLRGRQTESAQSIERRLAIAQSEMEMANAYEYTVINREIENTADEICGILTNLEERSCTTN